MVSLLSSLERVKEFMHDPTQVPSLTIDYDHARNMRKSASLVSAENNSRALMQLCDQAEPKSTGGTSKDQPWHSTLDADASTKDVIELGKTTLLKINASGFK
eukprot:7610460-Pyramimonas_sp.AAC.1